MDEGQEGRGEFAITSDEAPELSDLHEESPDQISALVDMLIEGARIECLGAWQDDRLTALMGIIVVAKVSEP